MKIRSDSFPPSGEIPATLAFGRKDPYTRMILSDNRNPHLAWDDIPEQARSLVLLCVDPDVPSVADDVNVEGRQIAKDLGRVDFYHWVLVDIPTALDSIAEGDCSDGVTRGGKTQPMGPPGSRQGVNDYTGFFATNADLKGDYYGYDGPCPPWNDLRMHHYHFRLYALDVAELQLAERFDGRDVVRAMDGHILDQAEIVGHYTLNPALDAD